MSPAIADPDGTRDLIRLRRFEKWAGIFVTLVGLGAGTVGLWMGVTAWQDRSRWSRADATILAVRELKPGARVWIAYPPALHLREAVVLSFQPTPPQGDNRLAVGKRVEVRFDPNNPADVELVSELTWMIWRVGPGLILFGAVVAAAGVWMQLHWRHP